MNDENLKKLLLWFTTSSHERHVSQKFRVYAYTSRGLHWSIFLLVSLIVKVVLNTVFTVPLC